MCVGPERGGERGRERDREKKKERERAKHILGVKKVVWCGLDVVWGGLKVVWGVLGWFGVFPQTNFGHNRRFGPARSG